MGHYRQLIPAYLRHMYGFSVYRQGGSHAANFRIARLKRVRFLLEAARTRGITKMLMAGSPNGEWRYLNLFREIIGGREIAVAIYENAADDEYRIVR
jgi:hypothetical protein